MLAVAVAAAIALSGGPAGEWTTVYLIERSLSLDNVFLFSLLLAYFLVPPDLRGRVIVIGIAGAFVLRAVAIAAARTAIHRRPTQVDPAGGGAREAVEVAGVPLRGAYEFLRVHAERRRGQRPYPWVLRRDRLPRHGPEPLKGATRG